MRLRELVFSEDADAGQVAISFHVIEAITDDEFVTDGEPDVIGFHRAQSRLQFAQENADFHAQGPLGFQLVADRRERDAAVENVVENEDMSSSHVGQGDLLEDHFTSGGGLAIIAGHAQAIQLQGQRDAPKQIGHENKAAIEDGDDGQFAAFVFGCDIPGKLIEPAKNGRLIEKNAVEVFLHRGHSIRKAGKQEDNGNATLETHDIVCTAYGFDEVDDSHWPIFMFS